jgi:hypothetical protein
LRVFADGYALAKTLFNRPCVILGVKGRATRVGEAALDTQNNATECGSGFNASKAAH